MAKKAKKRARPRRLRAVCGATSGECIPDLKRQFVRSPQFQSRVRISGSQAAGATELGWHRGHHSGIHDAYLTLRKAYPKAALALLDAFDMDKDGAISL